MVGFIASWITVLAAVAVVLFPTAVLSKQTSYPYHRCATSAPPQKAFNLTTTTVDVGNLPWGLIYLNKNIAFAAINYSIGVLDTSEFTPKLAHLIPVPPDPAMGNDGSDDDGWGLRELALTNDKRNLYVATGNGAVILDVPRAVLGRNDSVVGTLNYNGYVGRSSIELSISPDDDYVFVSQEFGSNVTYNRGAVEVYNVTRLSNGTVNSSWRGFIILGYATISQQLSADKTKLFVTSEMNKTSLADNTTTGIISILDVEKLKHTPGKSLIGNVTSGCRPVRCQMSADEKLLWVTQRDSNELSVFDADLLANNYTADDVMLATVNTGTSPTGLVIVGDYILTADSNRFNYTNATTGMTVINSGAVLNQGLLNFPQIQTEPFSWPRSLAVSPDGNTVLLSEYGTGKIRAVDVSSLNNP